MRNESPEEIRQQRATAAGVTERLLALELMSIDELAANFRELFGFETHSRSRASLRKRLAWRIQEIVAAGDREDRGAGAPRAQPLVPPAREGCGRVGRWANRARRTRGASRAAVVRARACARARIARARDQAARARTRPRERGTGR